MYEPEPVPGEAFSRLESRLDQLSDELDRSFKQLRWMLAVVNVLQVIIFVMLIWSIPLAPQ